MNFVDILRTRAHETPDKVCARDVERLYDEITYGDVWARSCTLAHVLTAKGVVRGGHCTSDMGTCPEMLYLVCAAAIGGFTVVALNTRLTHDEKMRRIHELPWPDASTMPILNADDIDRMLSEKPNAPSDASDAQAESNKSDSACTALFDERSIGVVMFTSGTTGTPKAAALPWKSLLGAAAASNAYLNRHGEGVWQLTLPMFHVGGLEIALRSILNDNPFIMYRAFHVKQVMCDVREYGATHVSVVNETLQAMMEEDAANKTHVLSNYECLLLGGAAPNPRILKQAAERRLRVYTSYGMTETCSQVASHLVALDDHGDLTPLALRAIPGYTLDVKHPDSSTGIGQLCVFGPGVFGGYLNADAKFSDDGMLVTGDMARKTSDGVMIAERVSDMFVSGGENVYPAEIRDAILEHTEARDAYVFGVRDAKWGRRPVAFVEAPDSESGSKSDLEPDPAPDPKTMTSDDVFHALKGHLSKIYMPDRIFVLREFPRSGIGKTDRKALQDMWNRRIDVQSVDVWRIKQPMAHPMRTSRALVRDRESLIVQVTDHEGRTGIGEDVAFSTDWYLPETIVDDSRALRNEIIPFVVNRAFIDPADVSKAFDDSGIAPDLPMARSAIENALWDLWCTINHVSLADALYERVSNDPNSSKGHGENAKHDDYHVPGGIVIGIKDVDDTVAEVGRAAQAGYSRVKLKIRPGHDVAVVRAVRNAYPEVVIVVDANQSYDEDDTECLATMRKLDALGVACIEEPLVDMSDSDESGANGATLFDRLDALQSKIPHMVICLDESWSNVRDLRVQLETHDHLRGVVMKLAKFGGIEPALEFYACPHARGVCMWVGGMYDYGISKSVHAAFNTLPGIALPGDLNNTSNYFAHDICDPPFVLHEGRVVLPRNQAGIGRKLCEAEIAQISEDHWRYDGSRPSA